MAIIKKKIKWEFPGGLIVRIQCFHYCGMGSFPGLGIEIPGIEAMRYGQNILKITKQVPVRLQRY